MGVPGNGNSKTNNTVNSFKCCNSGTCCNGGGASSSSFNSFDHQLTDFENYNNNKSSVINHFYINPCDDDNFFTFLSDTDIVNNNNHFITLCKNFDESDSVGSTAKFCWRKQKCVAKRYQVAAIEKKLNKNNDNSKNSGKKETKQKTPVKSTMRGASGRRDLEDDPLMRRPRRQLKSDSPKKQRKKLV